MICSLCNKQWVVWIYMGNGIHLCVECEKTVIKVLDLLKKSMTNED